MVSQMLKGPENVVRVAGCGGVAGGAAARVVLTGGLKVFFPR
jgi:uncharacterized protein YjeT (DUF2065 family)